MLKKYKHISFDLDGTLVHTIPEYRHKLLPRVVEQLNGNIKDLKDIDRFWFEGGRDQIIETSFGIHPKVFWELFRELDLPKNRSAHTRAYDDAEMAFRRLRDLGKTISIITGAPHFIAQMEIAKLNGAPYDFYLSIADTDFREKPNPESLWHALEKMKMRPEETLYIGNSNEDAHFAKNAGVDFIYLERKEHEFDLKDYAIAVIHSLDELFQ